MENYNEQQTPPMQEQQVFSEPKKPVFRYVMLLILLLLIVSLLWVYLKNDTPKDRGAQNNTEELLTTEDTKSESSSTPTTPLQSSSNAGIKLYSSPENGYSFEYEESWHIGGFGNLAILSEDPIPTNDFSSLLLADALVSPVPYASVETAPGVTATMNPPFKSHEGQVRDFAQQMDTSGTSLQSITINGLSGYSVVYVSDEGTTYNVLLEGKKNMLLVQFPGKNSKSSLSKGQLTILNTIQEK